MCALQKNMSRGAAHGFFAGRLDVQWNLLSLGNSVGFANLIELDLVVERAEPEDQHEKHADRRCAGGV